LVAAIIGKGGAAIADMRESCDVRIALTGRDEFYPRTECRVVTLSANDAASIDKAMILIVAKAKELAEGAAELTMRTVMPTAATGGIIGKGGEKIQQLTKDTGAKIKVDNKIGTGPGSDQTMIVTGSAAALEAVFKEANKQVQEVGTEAWFSGWASIPIPKEAGPAADGGGRVQSKNSNNAGLNMMWDVASNLPPYVLDDERGVAVNCVLPSHLCGGMIGRGGFHTKEIEAFTGAKIAFREIPNDTEHRSLQISGPLANTCTAYMMMMQRYLDVEWESAEQ